MRANLSTSVRKGVFVLPDSITICVQGSLPKGGHPCFIESSLHRERIVIDFPRTAKGLTEFLALSIGRIHTIFDCSINGIIVCHGSHLIPWFSVL